jgi:uncharacterized protein with HEPN domain
MRPEVVASLRDALQACEELISRVGNVSLDGYLTDRDLQLISERLIIAIGEAVGRAIRADATLTDRLPDARNIIGARNRIVHGYDEIRNEVVWDITVRNVPQLKQTLKALLSTE